MTHSVQEFIFQFHDPFFRSSRFIPMNDNNSFQRRIETSESKRLQIVQIYSNMVSVLPGSNVKINFEISSLCRTEPIHDVSKNVEFFHIEARYVLGSRKVTAQLDHQHNSQNFCKHGGVFNTDHFVHLICHCEVAIDQRTPGVVCFFLNEVTLLKHRLFSSHRISR